MQFGHAYCSVFQGLEHAQSVGYLIPSAVALAFLDHVRSRGVYRGVQEVRYHIHPLENQGLRQRLRIPRGGLTLRPSGGGHLVNRLVARGGKEGGGM